MNTGPGLQRSLGCFASTEACLLVACMLMQSKQAFAETCTVLCMILCHAIGSYAVHDCTKMSRGLPVSCKNLCSCLLLTVQHRLAPAALVAVMQGAQLPHTRLASSLQAATWTAGSSRSANHIDNSSCFPHVKTVRQHMTKPIDHCNILLNSSSQNDQRSTVRVHAAQAALLHQIQRQCTASSARRWTLAGTSHHGQMHIFIIGPAAL